MSVNKVFLLGNVGTEPDCREINGTEKAAFPLATTERGFTTSTGKQIPDTTTWHNVIVWGGLAKIVRTYVRKGSRLHIEGRITNREYEDKQGIKRFITEIVADSIDLCDSRRE